MNLIAKGVVSMITKHQFRAHVKNTNYDDLEDYKSVNDFANIGETLDTILQEHKELKKND